MEQHVTFRRVAGMLVGIVIISLGVALFKFAHLGNDPFNALNIRSAELAGLPLGVQNLIYNAVFFTMQMIWGRRYVGFGTVANAVCCGFIITFFYDFLTAHFAQAATLPAQLVWVAAAVVCTSLGISLHQTSDLGLPRMITWRWACGTTRHSPISAAAFLRIRCAHCWLFCWAGCWGWAP